MSATLLTSVYAMSAIGKRDAFSPGADIATTTATAIAKKQKLQDSSAQVSCCVERHSTTANECSEENHSSNNSNSNNNNNNNNVSSPNKQQVERRVRRSRVTNRATPKQQQQQQLDQEASIMSATSNCRQVVTGGDSAVNDDRGSSSSSSSSGSANTIDTTFISTTKQQQQQQVLGGQKNICAACGKPIKERYLLMALDKQWHEDCLKCDGCNCRLGEVGRSLFTRANKILCRTDFLRIFGQRGHCAACKKEIPPYELVMRANELAYHMDCFACQHCHYRFCVGDQFHLTDLNNITCTSCHRDHLQLQLQQQQQHSSNYHATTTNKHDMSPGDLSAARRLVGVDDSSADQVAIDALDALDEHQATHRVAYASPSSSSSFQSSGELAVIGQVSAEVASSTATATTTKATAVNDGAAREAIRREATTAVV